MNSKRLCVVAVAGNTHCIARSEAPHHPSLPPSTTDVKVHGQNPPELALHFILGACATHKHPAVLASLKRQPRVYLHFTPTGSSWLNLVERFFRQLTDEVVREGNFTSVAELVTAINVHLAWHNLKPTPYRWKAEGSIILEKIQRARAAQSKIVL